VGVVGITHNPLMWSALDDPMSTDLDGVTANTSRLREWVSGLAPDVVVVIASDHLHMLVTSNMPAFMIGKASRMRAIHPNETRSFGLQPTELSGDHDLAAHLLGGRGMAPGFDFAFSDEPWLDHSFMVPLLLLRPELDLPMVPVFTNANSPPIPNARRFAQLGSHLRAAIQTATDRRRVLVVGSGHLAHELGGPRQFLATSPDPRFDEEAVSWMANGDLESAIAGSDFDRLTAAGNETYQFLNFITCMALAGGNPATFAEGTPTRFGNLPFFAWEDL